MHIRWSAEIIDKRYFRLNNGDVTKQDAQLASCLQPSDFEKALGIIESAIGAPGPLRNTRKSTGITYESLFRVYSISESPTMLRIMHKVEQIVIKYAPDTSRRVIICTIFFWTCKVLKVRMIPLSYCICEMTSM